MYILKFIKESKNYFEIFYLDKNGFFTRNVYKSRKFLFKFSALKYTKAFKENLETVNFNEEIKMICGNARYVINNIIGIIENCKKYSTGDFKFITDEFADLISDEVKKEYEELFINFF